MQEAPSVSYGSRRAFLHVLFEQLPRGLIGLGRPSAAFSRFEGVSSPGDPRVALDRGEADAEQAGSAGLGGACLDGFDDPFAQVFGVGLRTSHDRPHNSLGQQLWCLL